jgi:putative FmdB family regulatory protein
MPLYDYDCAACRRRFEVVHGVHTEGPTVCPICGSGPIRKAISAAAVHFKGSGWAKKERRATATAGTAKPSGDSSSSEGGAKADDSSEGSGASSGSGSTSTSTTAVKPVETGTATKTD